MNPFPHNQKLRLFFALWPQEAEQQALAAWQAPLRQHCGGRVMRPQGLHATLVFLGEVAAERLPAVQQAAQAMRGERFVVVWDEVRYWRHNRIVLAAPSQNPPALMQLVASLEQSLSQQQFAFDRHSYQPHVTLLRNAQCREAPLPAGVPVRWAVSEFALVQSVLDQHGSHYQVLARYSLQ
jgi:2'-5' RNA ligase